MTMTKALNLIAAALAVMCCSCSLNVANGMLSYDSKDTRLGFARSSSVSSDGQKESSIIFDTKGAVGDSIAGEMSVRDLVIERLKSGQTVDQIAKSLGIDPTVVRDWIR